MTINKINFPDTKKTLEQEIYALRVELHYFKKDFSENYKSNGCLRLKLQKLWIYFLATSNIGIWTFMLYLVMYKL